MGTIGYSYQAQFQCKKKTHGGPWAEKLMAVGLVAVGLRAIGNQPLGRTFFQSQPKGS
jgi:hypothetical protein